MENNDKPLGFTDIPKKLMTFRVQGQRLAVSINRIKDVMRMVPIEKLEGAPHYCEGTIELRGSRLPVIDLRKRFFLDIQEWSKSTRLLVVKVQSRLVGMIVDSVDEMFKPENQELGELPENYEAIDPMFVQAVLERDDERIILLNLVSVTEETPRMSREAEDTTSGDLI